MTRSQAALIVGTAVSAAGVIAYGQTAPGKATLPVTSATAKASDRGPSNRVEARTGTAPFQRPDVDLRPPAPVPLLVISYTSGDDPEDYALEIDKDGTGRFIGRHNVCVTGKQTMEIPSDILEEAKRLAVRSRLFDHPQPHCSAPIDSGGFLIYFSEPPPGRTIFGELCPAEKPALKLGVKLARLLDLKGWIGERGKCRR